MGPISPLELERYELKYLIPIAMVEPISKTVERYCDMDHYSQISTDHFYTINSLYLDSPSLYLLRFKEMANAFCFNMRVRSYGSNPQPPYFFEIKYKVRDFVKKRRAKIYSESWPEILESGYVPTDIDLSSQENLADFLRVATTYNVGPVILTQYRRKAYISKFDDYARVTFDRDLRFQEQTTWSIKPNDRMLSHYDHPDSFGESGQNVVLELKCEKKIPLWIIEIIQKYGLVAGSFSKYGNSMMTHLIRPERPASGWLYR